MKFPSSFPRHFGLAAALAMAASWHEACAQTFPLRGAIVDAETGDPLPARLYIQSDQGNWLHAGNASAGGSAVPYSKERPGGSVEIHTTLSAHPFLTELPPGAYTLTVEHGKEYLPETREITIQDAPVEVKIPIHRWMDAAALGWFSGETHIHRPLADLPALMLAEDLNVALPLTAWVSKIEDTPLKNNRNPEPVPPAELIRVDKTHVIWPLNTEYEITSVGGKPHPLGALFVLNQKEPLDLPAPPVIPVALEARRQNALLDLDKHNWPWSLMLVPAIQVDLFELTNNHVWRTNFGFKDFYIDHLPEFMEIEKDDQGYTERGWIDFGLQTYYALLNCGFDIKPSAGTASGVHPVPLGFGRVYVKIDSEFDYDAWIEGLREGRSFVTTGPMLFVQFNGRDPGSYFRFDESAASEPSIRVSGTAASIHPLGSIEVIVNGDLARTIPAASQRDAQGIYRAAFDTLIPISGTSWIAVRVFEEREDRRVRFAHTGPIKAEVAGKELLPKRKEVEYFLQRMDEEIARNREVLSARALSEFTKARTHYERLLEKAR